MRSQQLPSLFLSPLFLVLAGGTLFPGHRMKTNAPEVPGHPEGIGNPSITVRHKTQFHLGNDVVYSKIIMNKSFSFSFKGLRRFKMQHSYDIPPFI